MQVESLGNMRQPGWMGGFEWSLCLGILGNTANGGVQRRYGSLPLWVAMAEAMDLFWF